MLRTRINEDTGEEEEYDDGEPGPGLGLGADLGNAPAPDWSAGTGWEGGNQDWTKAYKDQYGSDPYSDVYAGGDWNDIEAWRKSFMGTGSGGGVRKDVVAPSGLLNLAESSRHNKATEAAEMARQAYLNRQLDMNDATTRWARQLGHTEFLDTLALQKEALLREKQATYADKTGSFYTLEGQPTPPDSGMRQMLGTTYDTGRRQ